VEQHHVAPVVFTIFAGIAGAVLVVFALLATRNMQKRPGKLQNLAELIYEGFEGLVVGIAGEHGRKYVPLVGTLFLYILICNLFGLLPAPFVAPTASLNTTIALALLVFLYVQFEGIRVNGVGGYLGHFAGAGKVPLFIAPLLFVVELMGELAKPFSLAIRLYGNMFGKEQVVMALISFFAIPLFKAAYIPLPVQFPILLLGLLVAFVQAFVFALLTAIYLGLMTEHANEHAHAEEHAH
jgi:F-type H+-transporting ATPase subunit a